MRFPLSTGQAAVILGLTEPRLAQALRLGRIQAAPPVVAGRRLWDPDHLRQAARAFGIKAENLPAEIRDANAAIVGGAP